ncbi:MAG: 4'-phosphopantetheinyl transferase family protein [Longimicrobiales bacterium]
MIDEHTNEAMHTWQRMQRVPPLETDAVHVWRVRVGAAPAPVAGLSPGERARANRLAVPARIRFLTARSALRSRLAAYLGCEPDAVDFAYGETGKPALAPPYGLHFSVAHSADVALLAFARCAPVGVDLERLRPVPRRERIAPRVMAAASAAALEELPAHERDDAFIWAWTQREAYVKAIGGGVLRSADPLPFVWPPRGYESDGWTVAPLAADAHHHACLAVAGTGHVLRLFEHPLPPASD